MARRSKKRKVHERAAGKIASASPQTPSRLGPDWLWGVVLFLAVVLVYQPAWFAGLVWDDEAVVTANPVVIGPLGLEQIWTTGAADICPLTITTFWAEYKVWGATLWPYHLTTIFLHAACAVLLWLVLRGLRIPGAWLGAGLWALHPVQVESVAWITEMKNTESGFFYLLAILFFVRDLRAASGSRQKGWMYALALIFSALAMASKSSTVVLPLVFCLCAWWVEGRWQWSNLVKVAPVVLMSIAAALLSLRTQTVQVASLFDAQLTRSWPERLATAGDDVWFYLGKLLWPYPLLANYPRWQIDAGQPATYLALFAVIIVFVVLWWKRESWARPWFFAFAYFLVALIPVLGLADNTFFRLSFVADHFQYLASMAPLALVGAGIVRWGKPVVHECVGVGVLLLLGAWSWQQAGLYENEETLWTYTLSWNPNAWEGHDALGSYFLDQGRMDEAVAHFRQALEINPRDVDGHYNLGSALGKMGRHDEAMAQYRTAVEIKPDYQAAHNNLGMELAQKGLVDEAIVEFETALKIKPNYAKALYNLGLVDDQKGDLDAAIDHLQKSLAIKLDANTANSLGAVYAQKGEMNEALADFQQALQLDPDLAVAHKNLGALFLQSGRLDEAVAQFEEAVRLSPTDVDMQNRLAEAKAKMAASAKQK